MIPDLGKYAVAVLGSYGAALALITALIALSVWRSRRIARALRAAEARTGRTNG